ncbi:MAG: porin [Glaciimonas sp.]|nr:porin [Glaciimonas sp.]
MKKLILAASILAGFAGVAQAQSHVTIYGVMDIGLNYTMSNGGKNQVQMESGYAQGSRLGFKGREDLGGGLAAIFQLENGFSVDTGGLGQGGRMFGRQSLVGLTSASAGTVTLGRQYDSVVDFLGPRTANGNWAGYAFSHPLDNDNTDDSYRINNALKYTSINYSGFQFGGAYGFGEEAGDNRKNRTFSLGASYDNGPLGLSVGYLQHDMPGSTAGGSVSKTDYNFLADKQKVFGAGINYALAATTLGFVYTNSNLTNPTATSYYGGDNNLLPDAAIGGNTALNTLKFNNYEISVKQQISPAFYVGAMYVYTQGKYDAAIGESKLKWNTFGVMADYNLSKRTDVYAQAVYQKVGGDTGSVGPNLGNGYIPGAGGVSDNQKQALLRVALRHAF